MTPAPRSLLQGYFWEAKSQRYKYAATGRYVARSRIIDLLERSIDGRERRLLAGTQRFLDGQISPATWLSRTETMLKRQHLQEAALAKGGWDRLDARDLGRVGGKLQAEYRRAGELAGQVARGEVSEAQAANRVNMYLGNARQEFFQVERENLPPPEVGKVYVERRRLAARDKGNCPDCLDYADRGWQPEGVLPVPTEACQCLPGSAPVVADSIVRAFKRWYVGDLVEVITSLGHKLSATPNHPVATPSGWVAIGALHEGDQVIYDRGTEGMAAGDPNVVNVPTPIGEIFDALALAGDVQRMASLPVDFHGDGRKQEVYVVWAEDCLPDGMESAVNESVPDLLLSLPVGVEVCDSRLMTPGCFGSHMDSLEFAGLPEGDVLLGKDTLQGMRRGAIMPAHAAHRLAGDVGLGNLGTRQTGDPGCRAGLIDDCRLPITPDFHSGIQQPPLDSSPTDTVPFGERKLGLPGDIVFGNLCDGQDYPWPSSLWGLDSIISIHRIPFIGYVYNLTTEQHYYTTAGVVVKNCTGNCRCSLERKEVPASESPEWVGRKR